MKTEALWSERLPGKDNFAAIVFDLCFRPDGSQILVAIGSRVLVYDADTGDLLHSLKGHRDYVYAVAYSRDGKRFASGGADKTIIIWTHKCEGILKYSHNDSIQCLAYNPTTQQLASATASDFGLWSPEQKSVQKYKVNAKVLCCSWTNDGQYIALGQQNGHVSVRDKLGNEKVRIERREPIWTLAFAPPSADKSDVLAVGCWDQTLSFYDINGQQMNKDRLLQYDPCSISYYGDGEYILIGGANRKVSLYTRDGVFLRTVTERDDWVWAVRARPKHKQLVIGCNDGLLASYSTVFSTVHGLYQDRYAHRDTMTDVIIQHLITEQKVRIKTRDYVKKIAVYKGRLAIQLPDRVLIYETNIDDPYDMHYKLKEKIVKQLDCNLLVVTSAHIILCQEKKLQLFNFKGKKVREWVLEAIIRYIRVVGGPMGKEGLLIGLKNGCVYKIFIDNRFPVKLVHHTCPIRCLDLSSSRHRLAVVDEQSKVYVYDLTSQQVVFEHNNANSVAWNTEMEDMLCFSGNGQLCIKTGSFPLHTQALQGFVVGFKSSKIFCLHYLNMQTIDVPQSASLYRYLEIKDYDKAYNVACLGVTESDWRELALAALQSLNFTIARQAFIRIRDVRYIELLNKIEVTRSNPKISHINDESLFYADILAFQGQFNEAAKIYLRLKMRRKAVEMYLDLRDWTAAKEIIEQMQLDAGSEDGDMIMDGGYSILDLLKRQANWLLETGDNVGAAELFWASKDYAASVTILGQFGLSDRLAVKMRELSIKKDKKIVQQIAVYFKKQGKVEWLKETLLKLEEYSQVIAILVEQQQWTEAKQLVTAHPQLAATFWLPYADHLASIDLYEEAQYAYKMAGKPLQSMRMLETLIGNGVGESRYCDIGYYYHLLTTEVQKAMEMEREKRKAEGRSDDETTTAAAAAKLAAEAAKKETTEEAAERLLAEGGRSKAVEAPVKTDSVSVWLSKWERYRLLSELYYAYHAIHRYTEEPFTSLTPDALFHSAQFILHHVTPDCPPGISRSYTLYALAKQSKTLGAYKLCRSVYGQLLSLRTNPAWRDEIEQEAMRVRVKPFHDRDELLSVCYRCSTSNPCLNATSGERCMNCQHTFVRSFCSFEVLPLVRFTLAPGLTEQAAMTALELDWSLHKAGGKVESSVGNVQSLSFGNEDEDDSGGADVHSFQEQLLHYEPGEDGKYGELVVGEETLRRMRRGDVYIQRWSSVPSQWYASVIPDVGVVMCEACQHFFHEEDYEFEVLKRRQCPFCRTPVAVTGTLIEAGEVVVKR